FFQAEDGIRDAQESRGLGDVYKRQVLIESANYSIPSISFDVKTGPKEIIDNKRSGFLIEDGNLQEFANKLQILMQDEDLRKKFGKNAKEKVRKEFSKEVIMKKWIKLINS
ncbi:hypothetical protein K777_09810, partial [Campylobacter coli CVM 41970]